MPLPVFESECLHEAGATPPPMFSVLGFEDVVREEIIRYQLNSEPLRFFTFPPRYVCSDPLLHLAVYARRVLNSIREYGVELARLLARVVQHTRVLRRRHCSKECMSVVPVNRLEEDEVQQQPQRKAADENHRNGTLHFFVTVELQRDKRRDLRPDHAHDERQAAQFERMTEVQITAVVGNNLTDDATEERANDREDALRFFSIIKSRPVITVPPHHLKEQVERKLSAHEDRYPAAIVACC